MKLRLIFFFLVYLFVLSGCNAQADEQKKNLVLLSLVKESIEQGHFNPVALDDDFSRKAFEIYIDQLDPFKRFFTQDDLDKLKKHETLLDDEFKNLDFQFFELSVELLNKRIDDAADIYTGIMKNPFDLSINDYFELDPDKRKWPKNDEELKVVWEQSLKYEVLTRISDMMERQEKALGKKDSVVTTKTPAEMEADAREKVLKRYNDYFHELKKLDKSDRMGDFVNALVSVNDPHTNFFPPKDKQDFDIQFSGQLEGIGATLQSKDGYVTIVNIVPGGPAWKQGDLEVNDKIAKVAQGDGEYVDITDWRTDKAVTLIRGKKGTEARLSVIKMDGTEKEIRIIRDVVIIEETYAKSAVLQDKDHGGKVGYIYLPSFYANFDDPNGRSSSVDVRNEVEKLKKQGVEGIIIDLRGDGGGSLQDAIEIGGLFIPEGPIVQVKARIGGARVYGDPDPATLYDGPLLIMVNSLSASASEILAAAMQDFGRAIIVGTSQSFGKGTVQRFFNLDDVARGYDDVKPLGSLKMTIQKFYRINGGSTQLNGVKPDIVMSDPYTYFEIGERELKFPLEFDKVPAAQYKPYNNEKLFAELKFRSLNRMKNDPAFKLLDENARRLKEQRDKTKLPLNLNEFIAQRNAMDEQAKKYERIGKDTLDMNVHGIPEDLAKVSSDTTKKDIYGKWLKSLKTDNYILEATRILNDWNSVGLARKN